MGREEGKRDGVPLGFLEGFELGFALGLALGFLEGFELGCALGLALGCADGYTASIVKLYEHPLLLNPNPKSI